MKRKTKMLITALSAMLVMVLAITIVSFSLAGRGGEADTSEEQLLLAVGDAANSNIDNIIENSHLTATDADDGSAVDPYYRVVEIGSGEASALMAMCDGTVNQNDFMQYVINGNKTKATIDMKDKTLVYTYYKASTVKKDSPEMEAIAGADFIYVSCDPKAQYTAANDLGEDLYNFLKNTYLTQRKPLIIDNPEVTKKISGETGSTNVGMGKLATDVFYAKGSRYYTNYWDQSLSAEAFLRHQSGSLYLGINGDRKSGHWVVLEDGSDSPTMAKTLVISATADKDFTNNTMTKALFTYDGVYDLPEIITTPRVDVSGVTHDPADNQILKIDVGGSNSLVYNYGYNGKYQKPVYMEITEASLSSINADVDAYNFDDYDIIIIENNVSTATISAALYRKFSAAMLGNVTIIYDKAMITGGSSGSTGGATLDTNSSNYRELFYTVADTKGVSTRTNVMVTDRNDFKTIAESKSALTCKVIADLINASSFRGIGGGGGGSSSDVYTVLEIQPCYPVDVDLAHANVASGKTARPFSKGVGDATGGYYYTIPYNVANNKAYEELEDGTEYYNWELSVAKIADVTGLDPNRIQVVHMSSEEFAASKTEVLGNYDLVYIGADTSALRQNVLDYEGFAQMLQGNWNLMSSISGRVKDVTKLPIYTVYSHNGDIITLALDQMISSGVQHQKTGDHIIGEQFNNSSKTFARLNGNDITYNGYQELVKYYNAGMPIVISKNLSTYYRAVEDKGYDQNVIDPDSNMCKFLKVCYNNRTKDNVCWDFDSEKVVHAAPATGKGANGFGDIDLSNYTVKGYVTLFTTGTPENAVEDMLDGSYPSDGNREDLVDVIQKSQKRLSLSLTNSDSVIYNMYDSKTKFSSGSITYKLKLSSMLPGVSTKGCTFNFYIDDSGNSKFESSEKQTTSVTVTNTEDGANLTYTYPKSFFGPFYWKIEVVASNGTTSCITGLSYVQNKTTERQTINVLQIMPYNNKVEGAEGENSLYFCTVCQQAYRRLDFNPYCNAGDRYLYASYYGGNFGTAGMDDPSTGTIANRVVYWPEYKVVGSISTGHHEHTFGIVQYDSGLPVFNKTDASGGQLYGMDNWDINLADEVSDLFEFKLDIFYDNEVEAYANEIRTYYDLTPAQINTNIKGFRISDDDKYINDFKNIVSFNANAITIPAGFEGIPVLEVNSVAGGADYDVRVETVAGEQQCIITVNMDKMSDATKKSVSDLVVSKKYDELANEQWQLYLKEQELTPVDASGNRPAGATLTVADTEKDLRNCIQYIIDHLGTLGTFGSYDMATTKAEFQRLLDTGYYYDYYNMSNNAARYNQQYTSLGDGKNYEDYYLAYTKAKNREYDILQKYKQYDRIAGGENWLIRCYDTIILGAAEEFAGEDITGYALDDLERFVANDGTVLFFHDTLSKYADAHASQLTMRLRKYFGADRYGGVTVAPTAGQYFTDYNSVATDKYYTTKLPTYAEMQNAISGFNLTSYYSNVAFTDGVMGSSDSTNNCFPYRYADIKWMNAAFYGNAASLDKSKESGQKYGTDKATQNNKGIVTIFPFTLDEKLNVAPTHPQAYALNLDDDNMTVWYSLSASTNTFNGGSSLFAASPNDGMDNYFIYSYGNVNYCGAGHYKVTGVGKDNNDERRLYINIICNSVRKSINQPAIFVYDYMKDTTGDKVKEDGTSYTIKVDSMNDYPEFSLKAITDQSASLYCLRIYYDLDFSNTNTRDDFVDDEYHILIGEWYAKDGIKSGERFDVGRYIEGMLALSVTDGTNTTAVMDTLADGTQRQATRLRLLPRYFDPYNGEYTYIVIEAKDSKGNSVYQRIKIKLKDYLFNLT